ncbi:cytidylyltransferase domain-containing protein [Clostridium beijerinckii]|jgi:Spore coat polysaccharide biosynthesis protein F, CMP-KDO synthetase homolog|uniref:Glycosyltransferase family protein n=2 Tax=Clostridium beijerinckii TaxID=1520 RepID=A0AAE2V151_CLOBE|nr:glycosyltransferase family protein [Clostridium beijerinckii]ABR36391.1 acylneuraminate cytidylyltransferase [Clostridium beijerinckii NCIMB 8052]AIU01714.1 acylneuraminate cytidylyltransferase [Clostridium beijerinckii ATCC 35702]MBF7808962.1 glycosyltransferase family protein [Clostridium beijerinckii]NRT22545.1 spore coat polysaccharide biosynthesis protein SpsF [Clostridium beijerinckii]NRT64939.1 spore coat polysaccharide biosynthesis protein SpsF [Clostridium beijerinckii]
MKVVCIVQARVGSTRLPGKVLKEICGKTVLEHDVNRVKLVPNIDEIIIATTRKKQDDKIIDEVNRLGVKYFRGSENDVLSRYYFAAKENNADVIVRITSDCPCLDQNILTNMINLFLKKSKVLDYMNNTLQKSYPRGYDIEVFSFKALEIAFNNAKKDYEREHVTPYIYNLNNNFNIECYKNTKDYSKYRVTLDTEEDFLVISAIYNNLFNKKGYFLLEDVVEFLDKNPQIENLNAEIEQKKLGE